MKKAIGILLIVVALGVGYIGANKLADNTKEINLLGLKINASNESGQTQGIIYLVLALACMAGGVYVVGKAKE